LIPFDSAEVDIPTVLLHNDCHIRKGESGKPFPPFVPNLKLYGRRVQMKDKITGKAEEIKGKVTGDKGEELKGKARQGVGDVKQTGKEMAYDAEHPAPDEREEPL
jgi:uncharacterized protein YjbJ (UPF0337 family)